MSDSYSGQNAATDAPTRVPASEAEKPLSMIILPTWINPAPESSAEHTALPRRRAVASSTLPNSLWIRVKKACSLISLLLTTGGSYGTGAGACACGAGCGAGVGAGVEEHPAIKNATATMAEPNAIFFTNLPYFLCGLASNTNTDHNKHAPCKSLTHIDIEDSAQGT